MNRMIEGDFSVASSSIWLPEMQQQMFRCLLNGFSYPGRVKACVDTQTTAWMAILATLLDAETSLADPHDMISPDLRAKLETRISTPEKSAFILASGSLPPDFNPSMGTLEAPEQGATLLLKVDSLAAGSTQEMHLHLTGPGIKSTLTLGVTGLHAAWMFERQQWNCAFPMGVDMVLCDSSRFVVLPRTTMIQAGGDA
jgi:alpha-D-ribose 1-methylphosphonate 5-triphosphate synthase subunit PhnH